MEILLEWWESLIDWYPYRVFLVGIISILLVYVGFEAGKGD